MVEETKVQFKPVLLNGVMLLYAKHQGQTWYKLHSLLRLLGRMDGDGMPAQVAGKMKESLVRKLQDKKKHEYLDMDYFSGWHGRVDLYAGQFPESCNSQCPYIAGDGTRWAARASRTNRETTTGGQRGN